MYSQLARTFVATAIITLLTAVALIAAEPVLIGKGVDAKWSPDEKHISYLRGDALFIKNLSLPDEDKLILSAQVNSYEWLTDTSLAVMERKYYDQIGGRTRSVRIVIVDISGSRQVLFADSTSLDVGNNILPVRRFASGRVGYVEENGTLTQTIQISGEGKLVNCGADSSVSDVRHVVSGPSAWGQVWLYSAKSGAIRQLTSGPEKYLLPSLAPNGDHFVCNNSRGDMLVFDTLGNVVCNLGLGDIPVWNQDGSEVAFCRTEESEYDVIASDIFVATLDCKVDQLTTSSDKIELDPQFSPLNRYILYRLYPSNELYIVANRIPR